MDAPIVKALRDSDHDVLYIAELEPSLPDEEVLDLALGQDALLVTTDKDFGELVYRQRRITKGVVLIRMAGLSAEMKSRLVATTFHDHSSEFDGAFTVITPGAVRIRKST